MHPLHLFESIDRVLINNSSQTELLTDENHPFYGQLFYSFDRILIRKSYWYLFIRFHSGQARMFHPLLYTCSDAFDLLIDGY